MQNSKIAPDPPPAPRNDTRHSFFYFKFCRIGYIPLYMPFSGDMGIYIRCLLESFSALVWSRICRIKNGLPPYFIYNVYFWYVQMIHFFMYLTKKVYNCK